MLASLLAAGIALLACGGGDDVAVATPPATSTPAPTATAELVLGEPRVAIETAVTACRMKDAARLSRLVAGGALPSEIEALFALGSDVQLRSIMLPPEDETAVSVDVGLTIRDDTGTRDVERTWELQLTDGTWLFTSLPDCY